MKRTRSLVPVALTLASVVVLGACSAENKKLAQDFIMQWAADHPAELAIRSAGFPSGDKEVDAAVDAFEVVQTLEKADALIAKGRKNSDPKAMDEALALRPHDWSYELSRAHLALRAGDTDTYYGRQPAGLRDAGRHLGQAATQEYRELVSVHKYLYARGHYDSYYQCQALYNRLSVMSNDNELPAGNAPAAEQALWNERYKRCDSLPR